MKIIPITEIAAIVSDNFDVMNLVSIAFLKFHFNSVSWTNFDCIKLPCITYSRHIQFTDTFFLLWLSDNDTDMCHLTFGKFLNYFAAQLTFVHHVLLQFYFSSSSIVLFYFGWLIWKENLSQCQNEWNHAKVNPSHRRWTIKEYFWCATVVINCTTGSFFYAQRQRKMCPFVRITRMQYVVGGIVANFVSLLFRLWFVAVDKFCLGTYAFNYMNNIIKSR